MQVRVVGIAWYRREDYREIRRIMSDGRNLPTTWLAWVRRAEKLEQEVTNQGAVALRAHIDPETFPGWCAARGLHVDANARMRFANEAAGRHGQAH